MTPDDDFIDADDALVRALRAPGTPEELADEADFLAAFRAEQPAGGRVLRFVGRVGVGTGAAVAVVALSAGVAAAAYTQSLPDPVQKIVHSVLGPVGVPAAKQHHPRRPEARPTPTATPSSPPPATATHTPSGPPARTNHPDPKPSATPTTGLTAPPLTSPTTTPTTTPTGTTKPPARVPAALSISVSSTKVSAGSSVTVTGTVTSSDGHLLRNRVVRLQSRTAGHPVWARVADGRTDASGNVTLSTGALTQSTRLRLAIGKTVRSDVVTVAVKPTLNATVAESSGTSTLTISSQGGQAGDTVTAYRRQAGKLVKVGTVTLDANGSAVLHLDTPKRAVKVFLVLGATRQHGSARTTVTLGG